MSQTILYARISTAEQTIGRQRKQAEAAGFKIDEVVTDECRVSRPGSPIAHKADACSTSCAEVTFWWCAGWPGRCIVVPLSASEPPIPSPAHVPFPVGIYRSLTVTWAICSALASVSHARLDHVAIGREFLTEIAAPRDLARITDGVRHALGVDR